MELIYLTMSFIFKVYEKCVVLPRFNDTETIQLSSLTTVGAVKGLHDVGRMEMVNVVNSGIQDYFRKDTLIRFEFVVSVAIDNPFIKPPLLLSVSLTLSQGDSVMATEQADILYLTSDAPSSTVIIKNNNSRLCLTPAIKNHYNRCFAKRAPVLQFLFHLAKP